MSRRSKREEKKSCCTWPRIFLLVVILAISAFLIYWFEPWKKVDEIISNGPAGSFNGDDRPEILNPNQTPTLAPTPTPGFRFNQCEPESNPGDCCNGLEGLCDLRADEVMYATLHNGMATIDDGFLIGANHVSPLEEALEAGYRGLNLDICNCNGEIIFCHGICSFGPRDVVDVMQGVNEFLDRNPTETVVFIYQVNNDVDQEVDLNRFYDQLLLVDGLVEKLYVHENGGTPWPTLRQQTDPAFNKRIMMFHYNGPDCVNDPSLCPDGLIDYRGYASDNNWEHDDVESIEDRSNSCELRKNGVNSKTFVGLNNFVSPPSRKDAKTLNEYSAAANYVDACTVILQTNINFLLVDFWGEGDLPRFTQDHNAALVQRNRRERKLLRNE